MCEKEISFGQICVLILYDIPDYHLNSQYLGPETQGTLGKPSRGKSDVFLNIVQKAFGPPPPFI